MPTFDFQRLDVYNVAVEYVTVAYELARTLPNGHSRLQDQMLRAAASIPLNIAEGSGEFSRPEKARFYRMARRSAMESAAVLDILEAIGIADTTNLSKARGLLDRTVAMLTQMSRVSKTGAGAQAQAQAGTAQE